MIQLVYQVEFRQQQKERNLFPNAFLFMDINIIRGIALLRTYELSLSLSLSLCE